MKATFCFSLGRGGRVQVGLALEQDLALVGHVDAGQRLDQGGLARAVFAEQRQDLAGSRSRLTPRKAVVPPKRLVMFSNWRRRSPKSHFLPKTWRCAI